jgi:hypothetical protein
MGKLFFIYNIENPATEEMTMSDPQKPVSKISIYPITAAIWKNEGQKGAWYSVTIERTYKDGDSYKSSGSFGRDDLLILAKVADLAHSEVLNLEQADRAGKADAER